MRSPGISISLASGLHTQNSIRRVFPRSSRSPQGVYRFELAAANECLGSIDATLPSTMHSELDGKKGKTHRQSNNNLAYLLTSFLFSSVQLRAKNL